MFGCLFNSNCFCRQSDKKNDSPRRDRLRPHKHAPASTTPATNVQKSSSEKLPKHTPHRRSLSLEFGATPFATALPRYSLVFFFLLTIISLYVPLITSPFSLLFSSSFFLLFLFFFFTSSFLRFLVLALLLL